MIEFQQTIPMKYNETTDVAIDYLKLYFKQKWVEEICESLKNGYKEMSQINLNFAEMGLEEDVLDLCMYESKLVGREKL